MKQNDYNIVLVFDISKLNNTQLNKFINFDSSEIGILSVESLESKIPDDLKSVFSACFID